jgi:hypothetical protein
VDNLSDSDARCLLVEALEQGIEEKEAAWNRKKLSVKSGWTLGPTASQVFKGMSLLMIRNTTSSW